MIGRGRTQISLDFKRADMSDAAKVLTAYRSALKIHEGNAIDIRYLANYRNGLQPILHKEKVIRPEINNKLVLNHAQMITRNIVGYFLGTPIQYIQTTADGKDAIEKLNRYLSYENKAANDLEIGNHQSICGTAYRIIFSDGTDDLVPFEDRAMNPECTFVAYENSIAANPLFGATYSTKKDDMGNIVGYNIFIYTEYGMHHYTSTSLNILEGDVDSYNFSPYSVGGVPIIEYPNNMWRIGDWELVMELMNAINSLDSGRLDDIDQIVQSLLVFINADMDEETYANMRAAGVVSLKNTTNFHTDVKEIQNSLDQTGMNTFAKELEELLYALIGIPDRNNRAGGGADTGMAVELRDGWADLEVVARNKETAFKKAEKQTLRIILTILGNTGDIILSPLDVDIKFSRNKNNNLLVKTQSFQTLLGTKTLTPEDCLTIVDLVSDVNEYISRGKAFWGDSFANKGGETGTQAPSIDPNIDQNIQ